MENKTAHFSDEDVLNYFFEITSPKQNAQYHVSMIHKETNT